MSKIKKTALIGVVGASALTAGYYTFVKPSIQTTPLNQKTQNTNQVENKESKNTTNSTTSSTKEGVMYKDGTYTGAVTKTNKGDFQVSVVVQGGKISKVSGASETFEGFKGSLQDALNKAK